MRSTLRRNDVRSRVTPIWLQNRGSPAKTAGRYRVFPCRRSGRPNREGDRLTRMTGDPMLIPIVLAALTQAIPPATNAGARPALQEPLSATAAAKPEPWPPAGVFRPGGGVTAPKVTKQVRVSYTPDALRARVQGGVVLEAVVRA